MASAPQCISVLILLLATLTVVAANAKSTCTATFPVAGRKFKLQNKPSQPGDGVTCPEGNPSTVTFCKNGSKKVKIVGYFAAADLGICDPDINPYTLDPNAVVTSEQYGDMVILRITGRASSAFRCMILDGKKVCVGFSGQRYGVSTMTDCGPANC